MAFEDVVIKNVFLFFSFLDKYRFSLIKIIALLGNKKRSPTKNEHK